MTPSTGAPSISSPTPTPDAPLAYRRWLERNVHPHRIAGYRAVTLSLKRAGLPPGDVTADQMDAAAGPGRPLQPRRAARLARPEPGAAVGRGGELAALWEAARAERFATPNIGYLTDMIACPGGDLCALANARSLPIAAAINERFDDLDELHDIGDIDLHISGCINSCGHHHSGHIGILGVDKDGKEWYQVSLGGIDGSALSGGAAPGQGDRPVVRRRRGAGRDRGGDRHLPRPAQRRRRALHRHRQAGRPRAVQDRRQCGAPGHGGSLVSAPVIMKFIDTNHDRWHEVTADDSLVAVPAPEPWSLLTLAQWQAVRDSWPADAAGRADRAERRRHRDRRRRPAAPAAGGACFPKWVDGRAYSQARLLRVRYRFAGEIRATGEVLVDMLPLMARTGFDAALLRADQSLANARRVLGFFAEGHYQGDVNETRPRFARSPA